MTKGEQQKEGLFLKVSIGNIHGGFIGALGWDGFGVLAAISSFADDKGGCFPSQEKIAEICGVERKTINRKIKKLCEYRTEDGKAILEKKTVREGYEKARNFYRVLPSAGMAFGSNRIELVPFQATSIKEGGGHCVDSSKLVPNEDTSIVPNEVEDVSPIGTLTKAIELNPLELNPVEQEGEKAAFFESEKDTSSKTNKTNSIVDTEKELNKEKSNQGHGDIVRTSERERIASSIVTNGRNKEDSGKGSHESVPASVQDSLSGLPSDVEMAENASRDDQAESIDTPQKPLSQRELILAAKERNRIAGEIQKAKEREERRMKERQRLGLDVHTESIDNATTSNKDSEVNRPSVPTKKHIGRHTPFDGMTIEQILSLSEDEYRRMNV
ncbi:helix-turn-helix domain-containing protein [Sporosarcina sp. FSL K6-6792]|uniref:helix-turn-helix domain-containing protein n=1 Tax=Sporosarcina sp. FSL K6-6792 TaxID=2921559 RepID=UPI0030F722DC